jgi:flagellin-like protein
MSLYRKRFSRDNKGVSEIVGTILILLITVVIFSTIFIWVYTIPTPEASTKLQMEGALNPIYNSGVWDGAIINLTHQGGEELPGFKTEVYIRVNSDFEILQTQGTIQYGPNSGDPYGLRDDEDWTIGEVWSIVNHTIQSDDRVEVGVLESLKGEVIWSSNLLGAAGEHPPLFVQKWYDGNLNTIARDDLRGNESFGIYVQIEDNDGDFGSDNDVYVNVTELYATYGLFKMYDNGSMGDDSAGDGIWTAEYSAFVGEDTMDGSLVIITAEDDAGHNATTRLVLQIEEPKVINYNIEEGDPNGTDWPRWGPELLPGSGLQHYQIFNETEWVENRWSGNTTRTFVKGEIVVIVIASHFLPDTNLDNKFWLFLAGSGVSPQPIVYGGGPMDDDSIPSSTKAFDLVDYVGKFYVWEYRWNTSSEGHGFSDGLLDYGHYSLRVQLRSSYYPPPDNLFEVQDFISVTDEDGNVPDYPMVHTFLDPEHEQPSDTFNYTDIMYVKVVVQDTDGTYEFGNVKIQDFGAGIQVWAEPGVIPVSEAVINNSVSYKFSIDLTKPNFDPWLFGENAYTLRVMYLKDINEEYRVPLSKLLTIRGPRWYLDVANVILDYSHPVHDYKVYSLFYENLVFKWDTYEIQKFVPFPSQQTPPWGSGAFLSIVYSDLDGDTDLDVVEGIESGKLFMYRNQGGMGHDWQRREIDDLGAAVTAVDVGDIDQKDPLDDVVAGTVNGDLWWYKNDNKWTATFIHNTGSEIEAITVANMDGDDDDDLVVATGNEIRIYWNTNGVFGTVTTTDYFADNEYLGNGTVTGNYNDTHMSDNTYESIEEVTGTAYDVQSYSAMDEQAAVYDIVNGDYADTSANDGVYETLTEDLNDGPGNQDYWLLRNDTGDNSGHMYNFGNVSSGTDIKLYITSYISTGTEGFEVGWSTDDTPSFDWTITRTVKGTDEFDLDAAGFAGGQLYVWIRDNDNSRLDGDTDAIPTTLSIDFMVVESVTSNGTTSTLDHVWRIESIPGGSHAYKFFVEAYHTENVEQDDFIFQYSDSSSGPWTDMVTIAYTADPNQYSGASLPTTISGTLYVRVIDADSSNGRLINDEVFIDHMFIRSYVVDITPYTLGLGSLVNDVAVGDVDGDDDLDVAAATQSGNVYVRYNNGTGDLGTGDLLVATGAALSVDLGYIDGDDDLDVVVGTSDDTLYWFENELPSTTWTRTKIADTDGDVSAMRVGDVDGDYWDDIVIGTSTGKTLWYKNEGPGWTDYIIDSRDTEVYDLDIGDVDRGVTIELERD